MVTDKCNLVHFFQLVNFRVCSDKDSHGGPNTIFVSNETFTLDSKMCPHTVMNFILIKNVTAFF